MKLENNIRIENIQEFKGVEIPADVSMMFGELNEIYIGKGLDSLDQLCPITIRKENGFIVERKIKSLNHENNHRIISEERYIRGGDSEYFGYERFFRAGVKL